ncbi:MAG TPA: Spy/CpxP family protein refolding chaperone [Gemmatimonadaceae bacterium]|nr:Spy/CpxP family protein refolding chaperone [Gemmatimonadaceae bacterium]
MRRSNRSITVATLALVLLPSLAMGQYVRRDNNPFSGKPVPIVPVNVARTVIEGESDLELTDSQRTQIAAIRRELDSVAAPMLTKLATLKPTWRPAGGINDLSPEQREQLVAFRAAQVALIDSLSPAFAKARDQVMAVLRPEQRERAAKLEKNERKRAEETAKKELESPQQTEGYGRRRGQIRDGTGRPPLG